MQKSTAVTTKSVEYLETALPVSQDILFGMATVLNHVQMVNSIIPKAHALTVRKQLRRLQRKSFVWVVLRQASGQVAVNAKQPAPQANITSYLEHATAVPLTLDLKQRPENAPKHAEIRA